jgi:hypothetical protein
MDAEPAPNPPSLAPLSLAAAVKVSGVSEVTLRKHLKSGALAAVKTETGAHGAAWAIDPATLAAFVGARYGTAIDPAALTPVTGPEPLAHERAHTESAAELRARLDATLEELGRYRALAEAGADTNARVEEGLRDALAELRHDRDAERDRAAQAEAQAAQAAAERDAAQAEADRLRSRGWWARTFGGRG